MRALDTISVLYSIINSMAINRISKTIFSHFLSQLVFYSFKRPITSSLPPELFSIILSYYPASDQVEELFTAQLVNTFWWRICRRLLTQWLNENLNGTTLIRMQSEFCLLTSYHVHQLPSSESLVISLNGRNGSLILKNDPLESLTLFRCTHKPL